MTDQWARPAAGAPTPFAARYGLVRPLQGRYLAGVCAALGRATRTDPVLWRVVLAVLVCSGGIGALIYLTLWLVLPEEGDTGSPVEAMFGRGHSNTSPAFTVVLIVACAVLLVFALFGPFDPVLLGGAVVLGAAVLVLRAGGPRPWPARPATGTAAFPGGTAAPGGTTAPGGAPGSTPEPGTAEPPGAAEPPGTAGSTGTTEPPGTSEPWSEPSSATAASATVPPGTPVAGTPPPGAFAAGTLPPGTPTTGTPTTGTPTTGTPTTGTPATGTPATGTPPPGTPPAGGYRPPFAPHGPFAPHRPYAAPPAPRPDRSPLALLVLSIALVAVGALGALDLAGLVEIPFAGYVAAGLAVVGVGLVVGAWIGRARSLIWLGVLLALLLPLTHAAGEVDRDQPVATDVTWVPTTVAGLEDEYRLALGEGLLDLRQVDFAGQEVRMVVGATGADVLVLVPPGVEVTAEASVTGGRAILFGQAIRGVGEHSVTVPGGTDAGPEAGRLDIAVRVTLGSVEVRR